MDKSSFIGVWLSLHTNSHVLRKWVTVPQLRGGCYCTIGQKWTVHPGTLPSLTQRRVVSLSLISCLKGASLMNANAQTVNRHNTTTTIDAVQRPRTQGSFRPCHHKYGFALFSHHSRFLASLRARVAFPNVLQHLVELSSERKRFFYASCGPWSRISPI